MKCDQRRSTGVNSAMTLPAAAPARIALDFDALYRSARDDVFAYVAGLLHDRGAAEDVTALAFERAFRKRKSYDSRRGSARSWLFGIARNAALDELRRRRRTAEMPTELAGAADVEQRALERAAVRAALATLKARDREVIALKFHAGLDNAELAAVLGVSVSNAGTRLHRALTKLRETLDDQS